MSTTTPANTKDDSASRLQPYTGACSCGAISYTMHGPPLITHACYCTNCQRETGAAFAVNAMIEADRVTISLPPPTSSSSSQTQTPASSNVDSNTTTGLTSTMLPTDSGQGLRVWRCSQCATVLWTNYGVLDPSEPEDLRFVKVGTLHDAGRQVCKPGVHIYVKSKPAWVVLPSPSSQDAVPVFEEFYKSADVWSPESLERRRVMMERLASQGK